ncbi:helix-turn-helix domain-containing protein [Haladaptatus cibarius]|uniref:helix-turn-helix domain-containing protein n=1 Tax=Haladaptatus cibarius TaxID=453847 RepID=UPI000679DFBE|nr:helix-turn-helix domain-containing protein [Haladaptatus cibarius]
MSVRASQTAPIPDELASPRAKLVYLYLTTARSATLDELQNGLGLPKMSLYTIVRTLRERELVEQDGETVTLSN